MPRIPKPWYWKQRDLWCVDINKKRYNLARGKASRAEAQAEFHRVMVSLWPRDGMGKAYEPTVEEMFDIFLDAVEGAVQRGERTQVTYDGYVRYLSPAADHFGAVRATDLTQHQVHAWCDAPALKWGPTTRANAIVAVKAAFRWAKRRGIIHHNPVSDMEKPTPRRRTLVLSPEQGKAVLEAAEPRFRKLLTVLWLTGCRPGELSSLEAKNVDLEGAILHVIDKIRRTTGKETREVHAVPEAMAIVAELCAQYPEGPIFRGRLGNAWNRNSMAIAFRKIRDRTGIGAAATAYSFRHLFGTDALDAGVHAAIVAELMGHRGTKMLLERYSHLEERRGTLRDAARAIRPGPPESGG